MSILGCRCRVCGQVNLPQNSVCNYCKKTSGLRNAKRTEYMAHAFKLKKGVYKDPIEENRTKKEIANKDRIIIERYSGNIDNATLKYQDRAKALAAHSYFPKAQNYQQGEWGGWAFLVALLLCFIIVGFLVFIYMLIVKPEGVLTVTYEYRKPYIKSKVTTKKIEEKQCPDCAENVKKAAKKCRFCGFLFDGEK